MACVPTSYNNVLTALRGRGEQPPQRVGFRRWCRCGLMPVGRRVDRMEKRLWRWIMDGLPLRFETSDTAMAGGAAK